MGGAVCLCGAKWGVSPGIRGGFACRYAAVGRILKRAGWARLALTAAWNTYAPVLGITVPGLGTSGGLPKATIDVPITLLPRDTNVAHRDIVAVANVYALANGFFSMAQCHGEIAGDANTHLILTDRHL